MAEYTAREYRDMLVIYGIAGESALAASRLYAERFPNRRHPSVNTILKCFNRAGDTGQLLPDRRDTGAPIQIRVGDEERILREFEELPRK